MPECEDEQGRVVAHQAIETALTVFEDRLSSAYLIGSLAHGGFVAAVSDVDVALVLDGSDAGDPARIQHVADRVRAQNTSALADRLSLFWTSSQSLQDGQPIGRLPAIDWLDLVENGRLAYGTALSGDIEPPTTGRLMEESARFVVDRWGTDPQWAGKLHDVDGLVRQGRRAASKAALFPVRFLYTLATGQGGVTDSAVDWYISCGRPARQLVGAAYRWRTHGIDDHATAARLLAQQLVPLYAELETDYRPRLVGQNLPDLARDLTATIARLDSAVTTRTDSTSERSGSSTA